MGTNFLARVYYVLPVMLCGLFCSPPEREPSGSSVVQFQMAEQALIEGRYHFAATHLDKGIVAFRVETGKMSGGRAIRANRAIDALTRLRQNLRQGQTVRVSDLQLAIRSAMEAEQIQVRPKNNPEIMVPVGGN